jgi:hypothetical protein
MAINDAKAATDLATLAMESNDAAALLEGDRAASARGQPLPGKPT